MPPVECYGNRNERTLVGLIHVDFVNTNTILWKSSYLTCSDVALWGKWAFRRRGRKEKEELFMEYLEARQRVRCFSVTSCVISEGNLSGISNLTELHIWDLNLGLFICPQSP